MMLTSHSNDTVSSLILPDQTCQRLTLAEIQSATDNFDKDLVIGQGGFGTVYRCSMMIGSVVREVAIKRLDSTSHQGATEFEAEVKLLSKLRHGNLVSLIGYCSEEREMILVYEFMPNGTIRDHLRKADCDLSWSQRLKICIGAARALDYLHTGPATEVGVIHRDVKTSNILLDAKFAAKVSDFGLAKVSPIDQTLTYVSTEVRGSHGYLDPSYIYSKRLTRKSDVYAFGVVLLEVLSGKQAVFSAIDEDCWTLSEWAQDQIKKGKLDQLIDPRLKGQISRKCLKEYANIAIQCLHNEPKQRPMMADIVVRLKSILVQEREILESVVDEGTFVYKLRSFFTVKPDLTPPGIVRSKSEVIHHHTEISGKQNLKAFTYDELASATNSFKNKERSSSSVLTIYKGWVDEMTYTPTEYGVGLAICVRVKHIEMPKLNGLDLKPEEFNHPNIIKLLGYCMEEGKLYCVYKFTPDTSLDRLIFNGPRLPWITRLKIALGAAQGLSFLHRRDHMAYNQFKSSVILLDNEFNVRLSDFEVEKSFLFDNSYSFGTDAFYAAPEWFSYQEQKLELHRPSGVSDCIDYGSEESIKTYGMVLHQKLAYIFKTSLAGYGVMSEVYAFGVVLLELLSWLKVFDVNRPQGQQNLVKWATPLLSDEDNLWMIVDLRHNGYLPNGAFKLAQLALSCLHPLQEERPSMGMISNVLYKLYQEETQTV